MPWARRGDFNTEFWKIRAAAGLPDHFEVKWSKIDGGARLASALDLIAWFFQRPWLSFHCLIVRKADVDKNYHNGDFDLARRKHLVMLLTNKMRHCTYAHPGYRNVFRVWIDPIASRYAKADEAAAVIGGHILSDEPRACLESILSHDSKNTPSIQLCDLLLGAVMQAWQGNVQRPEKRTAASCVASHLGWDDLHADTRPTERKFNIWYFVDPRRGRREVATRETRLRYPLPSTRRTS